MIGSQTDRYCASNGVAVSMGHSSASYEKALLGIANGATSMTHVYNGMTPTITVIRDWWERRFGFVIFTAR